MSISLKRSQPVAVKWSASHVLNNLTVFRDNESRRSMIYGVSHKSGLSMVTVSEDGNKQIQGQIICRILGSGNVPVADNDTRYLSYVVQASFISLPVRTILVLACTKNIQVFYLTHIYEPDGMNSLFFHCFERPQMNQPESSIYFRGIAGINPNLLCVGNHLGEILIFTIPSKGSNFFLKECRTSHQYGITSLASNESVLVSSDTSGVILIWNVRTMSQINVIEKLDYAGVCSLSIFKNIIISSYGNGVIRFFDSENRQIVASINAHARSINAIDCNEAGFLASVGDDCFVRLWRMSGTHENIQIDHVCNHYVESQQLVGVRFISSTRPDLAVSAYDSSEIIILRAI